MLLADLILAYTLTFEMYHGNHKPKYHSYYNKIVKLISFTSVVTNGPESF